MYRIISRCCPWALAVLFVPVIGATDEVPSTATVPADPRFADIRQQIVERVESGGIPSFAIGVVQDGVVLWEEAFGWADRERRVRATPRTAYGGASVAKTLTAAGVLAALDRKLLSLDDPADRYLEKGDLETVWFDRRQIRIRHLLTMTAGLPQGFKSFVPPSRAQSARHIARNHGGLVGFPVGEFLYSNHSFGVLELVLEGASGRRFDEFMREALFEPLAMTSTFYETYPAPVGVEIAVNYIDGTKPVPPHASSPAGGAGVRTSAHDLLRFTMALAGSPLGPSPALSPTSIELMEKRHLDFDRPLADYGLGIWMRDLDGLFYLVSNGHGEGGVAELLALPEPGIGIVSLMNTRRGEDDYPGQFTEKINALVADVLVPGAFDAMTNEKLASRSLDHGYEPSDELLGVWTGFVRDPTGDDTAVEMLFQPDGDIHVRLGDQYEVLLNGATRSQGVLRGEFPGLMRVDEKPEHDHAILVYLRPWSGRLVGFFEANYEDEHGAYALPNLVWLERAPPDEGSRDEADAARSSSTKNQDR